LKTKYGSFHSQIGQWLQGAGYCRQDIASELGITYYKVNRSIEHPQKHLTLRNMMTIAGMVQRPFIEVLMAVIGNRKARRGVGEMGASGIEVE